MRVKFIESCKDCKDYNEKYCDVVYDEGTIHRRCRFCSTGDGSRELSEEEAERTPDWCPLDTKKDLIRAFAEMATQIQEGANANTL